MITRTNILRFLGALLAIALLGFIGYRATRPQLTDAEKLRQQPQRFTFIVPCKPQSMGLFVNPFNMQDSGENKPGKVARKYTLACTIPAEAKITTLYDTKVLAPSIPMPKPGESHTFTLLEDSALALVDLDKSAQRLQYPIDSEGMKVSPVVLWDWAKDNTLNLVCFEDISSSTQQPEHTCWLN